MITVEQVLTSLKRIVAEKGEDYVYPIEGGCWYTEDEITPSCLAGLVIKELSVELYARLRRAEGVPVTAALDGSEIEKAAFGILQTAQELQDFRMSYGGVLDRVTNTL